MNCHELATVEHYRIPVIIVIFDNGIARNVRQWQHPHLRGALPQTDLDRGPDFVSWQRPMASCGRGKTQAEFEAILRTAVDSGEAWVIDCAIDKDAMVHPMPGGAPATEFLLD